ncbi:hypothetical protein Lser_V15G28198 [Lactuca serriola]
MVSMLYNDWFSNFHSGSGQRVSLSLFVTSCIQEIAMVDESE